MVSNESLRVLYETKAITLNEMIAGMEKNAAKLLPFNAPVSKAPKKPTVKKVPAVAGGKAVETTKVVTKKKVEKKPEPEDGGAPKKFRKAKEPVEVEKKAVGPAKSKKAAKKVTFKAQKDD